MQERPNTHLLLPGFCKHFLIELMIFSLKMYPMGDANDAATLVALGNP